MNKQLYFNITLSVIKGIGFRNSQAIWNEFGENSFNIIKNETFKLSQVNNIGSKKAELIKKSVDKNKDKVDIFLYMISLGFTFEETDILFKKYKKKLKDIVEKEIYTICKETDIVDFKKLDYIATTKLNYRLTNEKRILNGIVQYTILEHDKTNNTLLEKQPLLNKISNLLKIDDITDYYNKLIDNKLLIEEGGYVAVFNLNDAEKFIANYLNNLSSKKDKIKTLIPLYVGNLNDKQMKAFRFAIHQKLTVITGGAGTGKTTLLKELIKHLPEKKLLLCAPTGKAAQRMTESTGQEAKTIHKLLDFNPVTELYRNNDGNKLDCDVLIVDEVSMIDTFLFANLLLALPDNTKIILVGDHNQVPSVSHGSLLRDILNSERINIVKLNKIYRTAEESDIIKVSHDILENNIKDKYSDKDFFFIESDNDIKTNALLKEIIENRLEKSFNIDPFKDLQILSPVNNGMLGVNTLNNQLQPLINKTDGNTLIHGDRELKEGDRVIQVINNYKKGVVNGEQGIIATVEKRRIFVLFGEELIKYTKSELNELKLCYSITVHKSQGSEYKATIILLPENEYSFIDRGLIYTAITRSKELCIIIGKKDLFNKYCQVNKSNERITALKKYII